MKAYLHIYELIKHAIVTGAYPYGSKIPSKRVCAQDNNVSLVTVEHAYELLAEEGYIEPKQRSGYIVAYKESDMFLTTESSQALPVNSVSVIANSNVDEQFPFSVLTKTMRKVILDYGESIMVRSPGCGHGDFRAAIAGYLARSRGIEVQPEQIVIGAGAEYLYGLIVELLGRGKTYAIENPSYEKIEQVYRARGVDIELLPISKHGISSKALEGSEADVLHVTPYRSYPTGVTATISKRKEYITWASSGGRYIIEDDFESEFSLLRKPEETLYQMSTHENVIYINTFSRTISPSIRVGYMVLPRTLIGTFEEKVGFYSCTVPMFEQLLIAQLLRSGDFERHINRIRRKRRNEGRA